MAKSQFYAALLKEIEAVLEGQRNWVAGMANVSSLVYHGLKPRGESHVNWVGFYVRDKADGTLILGPFQGEVACVLIGPGRGVCGAAAKTRETQLVPNVHEFPGHIACSDKTNSEIVVPMFNSKGNVVGVFDLDATNVNGFDKEDQAGLEAIVVRLMELIDWPVEW